MGEEVTQSDQSVNSQSSNDAGSGEKSPASEKCENITKSQKSDGDENDSVLQKQPHDGSMEKSKKWYNISFINRSNSTRSSDSCEKKKISDKMDKRHSWHLNDSAVVEM